MELNQNTWWNTMLTPIPSTEQNNMQISKTATLGKFDDNTQKEQWILSWLKLHSLWAIGLISLFLLIWGIFFYLTQINIQADQNNPTYESSISTYKSTIIAIDETIWYPWINEQQQLAQIITDTNIQSIIASTIPFIFKKDIIISSVETLINTILQDNKKLQDSIAEITKFWFIHPIVMWLLEENKNQIPIMVSLHTLETIKFGTAMQIFAMLDTFLQQGAQRLWINKDTLASQMENYAQRWERDIANYLSTCYLNPYENFPNCTNINDFEKYFLYESKEETINTAQFSQLFALLEDRLERSTVPSLQLDFNRFNPSATNIAFRVTVNTLAEDDLWFLQRGIINPHVFITSTLVSLLKQSLFVIGDAISIDRLNIKQQNITVWNIQVPVNTSSLSFDLPLQNSSQREIFDFYENF